MSTSNSRQRLWWYVVSGLMVLDLLMIFVYPRIQPRINLIVWGYYSGIGMSETVWRTISLYMSINYPLAPITYLLPFVGIIYLALVIPKDKIMKRIRYVIAVVTMIIVCYIIARWIHTADGFVNYRYDYFYEVRDMSGYENIWEDLTTWYTMMDFIMWR